MPRLLFRVCKILSGIFKIMIFAFDVKIMSKLGKSAWMLYFYMTTDQKVRDSNSLRRVIEKPLKYCWLQCLGGFSLYASKKQKETKRNEKTYKSMSNVCHNFKKSLSFAAAGSISSLSKSVYISFVI